MQFSKLKWTGIGALLILMSCNSDQMTFDTINLSEEQLDILFVSVTEGYQKVFAVKDSFPDEIWNISYSFGQYGNLDPTWSADGRKFAFTDIALLGNEGPLFANIFIRNMDQDTSGMDSSILRPVTYSTLTVDSQGIIISTAVNARPDWNSVSNKMVFISNRDSIYNIFVTRISPTLKGDTIPIRLTDASDKIDLFTYPAWSPDGNQIIYNCAKSGHQEVWIMYDDGSGKTQLTFTNANVTGRARFSPTGDKIAFFSTMGNAGLSDSSQIYTMDYPGGWPTLDTITTAQNNFHPAWSPDGLQIIFAKQTSPSKSYIYVINRDGTGERRLISDNKAFYPIWRMK